MTKAMMTATIAAAETIRTASPVVSGHLYAALMSHGLSMSDYEAIIQALKNAKLVKESGFVLTWIGPNLSTDKKS